MSKPKPLTKEMVLAAMAKTLSNRAAARYLGCSYMHYKRYAKLYRDEEQNKSLFEVQLNQQGKGIPKFLKNGKKETALLDILEGRVDPTSFGPDKIKRRLVVEGLLEECCNLCRFAERRISDYKMPLLLNFKDKNKKNYQNNNPRLLCYNCYYINVGDIFTSKQIEGLEDHVVKYNSEVEWELDEYTSQRLKELGLDNPTILNDGSEFISKW
jgi:hypothetical protein